MTRPCSQPPMTVRLPLAALARRVAHGTRHMRPVDLAIRAALVLACLVVSVWMIHRGEVVWPLVLGVLGSISLAIDAVELYAVGAVCDRLAESEEDR